MANYETIKEDEYPEDMTFRDIERLFKKLNDVMRCKNCRYWNELPYNKEKGECINTLICEHIFSESYDTVDMYFSPGFGCIHFERKEDEGDKPTSGA